MDIILEFDENKNYSALEWLGWITAANDEFQEYQKFCHDSWCAGALDYFRKPIFIHDARCEYLDFIAYCRDRAELEMWYQEIRSWIEKFTYLLWGIGCDSNMPSKEYAKLSNNLYRFAGLPKAKKLEEYYAWAVAQLKDGKPLHELPGWDGE